MVAPPLTHARARQALEADLGKERDLADLKSQRLLLAEDQAATLRKEVEGLRTLAVEAVEEADREHAHREALDAHADRDDLEVRVGRLEMETEDVQISIITITRPAMACRCSATPPLLSGDPRTRTMGKIG